MKSNLPPMIILLVAIALLACLFPLAYGMFMLIRFVAAVVFAALAYDYFKRDRNTAGWVFVALTLLFQPLFKIALTRTVWNVVDVVVAIGLVVVLLKRD
jgi:hypothetical protein